MENSSVQSSNVSDSLPECGEGLAIFQGGRCFPMDGDGCFVIGGWEHKLPVHLGKGLPHFCVHQQCDIRFQIVPENVVLVVYVVAIALLLIFFVWETGPFHKHRTSESVYLFVVLFSIAFVTAFAEFSDDCKDIVPNCFIQLILLQVVFYLLRRTVQTQALPSFFSQPGTRQKLKTNLENRKGMYATRKIDAAIRSVARSDQKPMVSPDLTLCIGVFACLMMRTLSRFDAATDPTGEQLRHDPVFFFGGTLWLGIVGYTIVHDGPLLLNRRSANRTIRATIESLVNVRDVEALGYVLANVSVASLAQSSPVSLKALVEFGLEYELLNTTCKAILIDAIMKVGMGATEQIFVQRLIFSCKGKEMTILKNLIDGSGGYQNLYKLIYVDITNTKIQTDVIRHVVREAHHCRRKFGPAGVKILSDVDDTILCSGGAPAGCDKQYPKKAIYPGVLDLYHAMDDRSHIADATMGAASCNLVFLSARPHIYKGLMEDVSYQLFQSLVEENKMHVYPTLLPGNLIWSVSSALLSFVWGSHAWRAAGEVKFETFKRFQRLYYEYNFIFSGDDGQGDLLAGERMLQQGDDVDVSSASSDDEEPSDDVTCPRVLAVLIHEVLRTCEPLTLESPEGRSPYWREDLVNRGLIFHKTYLGAALALHEAHPTIVESKELGELARHAVKQFEDMRDIYSDEWGANAQRQAARDLMSDLERVNVVLRSYDLPELNFLDDAGTETEDSESTSPLMKGSYARLNQIDSVLY